MARTTVGESINDRKRFIRGENKRAAECDAEMVDRRVNDVGGPMCALARGLW